jgi:thioredoxin-like negative regulator of GroEL
VKIRKINSRQLNDMLAKNAGQFVAIFSTEWCGYCRALMREIEATTIDFTTVEVDISNESDNSWERFEINLVPTAILFEEGKEVGRKTPTADRLGLKDIRELVGKSS